MSIARAAILTLMMVTASGQALAQFGGMRHGRDSGSRDYGGGSANSNSEVTRISANDRIRIQLTDLRFALALAPEQNAPFDEFQKKVLAVLSGWPAPGDAAPGQEPAALAKIAEKVGVARSRWTEMQAIYDSAAKLYSVLTDEQKAVADRMLADAVPAPYSGGPAAPAGAEYRSRGR